MEFIVDKPWKFDEKQLIVLNIVQTLNLNYALGTLQPFENQLTRNIGYIGTGPISLHIYLQKCGYAHGEKIPIQVYMRHCYCNYCVNNRTHQIAFELVSVTATKTI